MEARLLWEQEGPIRHPCLIGATVRLRGGRLNRPQGSIIVLYLEPEVWSLESGKVVEGWLPILG